MKIIKPNEIETWCDRIEDNEKQEHSIFLAGTIDNGDSYDWQYYLCADLADMKDKKYNYIIYNPRRSNWNPNATKDDIKYQINWEQEYLDKADTILMYFDPKSKSPISLLELGLYARSKKMLVILGRGFYRSDNVIETCQKYHISLQYVDGIYINGGNKEVFKRLFSFIDSQHEKHNYSEMTLDEAIEHSKEVSSSCTNRACAHDHLQLYHWLKELKEYKNNES